MFSRVKYYFAYSFKMNANNFLKKIPAGVITEVYLPLYGNFIGK